jgi:hypothetical protein
MTILDQYDRAWRHFEMIAQQRIASFNHYLIVLGVLLTASAAVKLGPMHVVILGLLGAANMIAPILFFFLDMRIRRLLDNLKGTLFLLENTEGWPELFKPFHRDAAEQGKLRNKFTTYTGVFWSIFAAHFVLGFSLLHFSLLLYAIGCPQAIFPTSIKTAPRVETPQKSKESAMAEDAQSYNGVHIHYHYHINNSHKPKK